MKLYILLSVLFIAGCANAEHDVKFRVTPSSDLLFCDNMSDMGEALEKTEVNIKYTCRF